MYACVSELGAVFCSFLFIFIFIIMGKSRKKATDVVEHIRVNQNEFANAKRILLPSKENDKR